MVTDDGENHDACNKDTGEKQKSLQKWSRGLLHYVRSGGHIDRWNPLFVYVCGDFSIYVVLWGKLRIIFHYRN